MKHLAAPKINFERLPERQGIFQKNAADLLQKFLQLEISSSHMNEAVSVWVSANPN